MMLRPCWRKSLYHHQFGLSVLRNGGRSATGLTDSTAGGLIGYNSGPVSQVYATGAVNGYNDGAFGGLIGQNAGELTNVSRQVPLPPPTSAAAGTERRRSAG